MVMINEMCLKLSLQTGVVMIVVVVPVRSEVVVVLVLV